MLKAKLLEKTCICGKLFMQQRPMQTVCSPMCARKKVRADKKAEREETKRRKEALKPLRKLLDTAQKAFNAYIKERDKDWPCISCGETNPPMTSGGQWDAGHFLSRGAYPELRFDEDNCHKQCKSCNGGSGKFAHKARTTAEKYEANLIEKIGRERVEALKAPRPIPKLDRQELIEKAATYRKKLRDLKAGSA